MIAFRQALDAGADGIEFDVRLSSDGVPVVIHDSDLRRVGLRPERVSTLTAGELGQCDVGSWFNRRFPAFADRDYVLERVPTLRDFLTFISGTSGVFYLELKPDKGHETRLASAVSDLVREHRLEDSIVVLSFDLAVIKAIKELNQRIRTAALFQPHLLRTGSPIRRSAMVRAALQCDANEIALHRLLVTPGVVRRALDEGLKVVVWTVDNPAWVQTATRLGVHAIITNRPAEMILSRNAL